MHLRFSLGLSLVVCTFLSESLHPVGKPPTEASHAGAKELTGTTAVTNQHHELTKNASRSRQAV